MRDELIRAAIERFGTRGFEAVGTREIAASVGTPMSSITYHFGGKEGLYLAAAEYIFDNMQAVIMPHVEQFPDADADREEHVGAIVHVFRVLGEFMLNEASAPFALFVNREQQEPTPKVRELMDQKVMPMLRQLSRQVQYVRPELTLDEARTIAIYLFGVAVTLRHGRASICLLFETDGIDEATRTLLLDQLEKVQRAILLHGGAA